MRRSNKTSKLPPSSSTPLATVHPNASLVQLQPSQTPLPLGSSPTDSLLGASSPLGTTNQSPTSSLYNHSTSNPSTPTTPNSAFSPSHGGPATTYFPTSHSTYFPSNPHSHTLLGNLPQQSGAESRQASYYQPHQSPTTVPAPSPGPGQWRKGSLRPSASVLSLGMMKSSASSSAGESSGQASPVLSTPPMGPPPPIPPPSGLAPATSGKGGGNLLKAAQWFGLGKGKGKHREEREREGLSVGLTSEHHYQRRGRGSSRPEAATGLGLGLLAQAQPAHAVGEERRGSAGSVGPPQSMAIPPGTPKRMRSPSTTSPNTPSRLSPLGRHESDRLSSGLPASATALGLPTAREPGVGIGGPKTSRSGGIFARRQTVGSLDPEMVLLQRQHAQDASTTASIHPPQIPAIVYNASSAESQFVYQKQPLSPPKNAGPGSASARSQPSTANPSPNSSQTALPLGTSSAPVSNCPSPDPSRSLPLSPPSQLPPSRNSQESTLHSRMSIDALRQTSSGLLAASKKPWSKSVDDLSKMFRARPTEKAKMTRAKADEYVRAGPIQVLPLRDEQGSASPATVPLPLTPTFATEKRSDENSRPASVVDSEGHRTSWTAREMLKDVSQRDQLSRASQESERPAIAAIKPRRLTKSFSGSGMIASASMTLLNVASTEGREVGLGSRAVKASSPPLLMRSGGGLSSSSSSPMLSTFIEAADAQTAGTPSPYGDSNLAAQDLPLRGATPMRGEPLVRQGPTRKGHGRSQSAAHLLLLPFTHQGKVAREKEKEKLSMPTASLLASAGALAAGALQVPEVGITRACDEEIPTPPAKARPAPVVADTSLLPAGTGMVASSKRSSQIVHKEGLVMRYTGGSVQKSPKPSAKSRSPHIGPDKRGAGDYFTTQPIDATRGWKPFKLILKGNKAYFYKPPSDKKSAIESLFPTSIVPDQLNSDPDSPGTSPQETKQLAVTPPTAMPRPQHNNKVAGALRHLYNRPVSVVQSSRPPSPSQLDFPIFHKPALIVPLANSRAASMDQVSRSWVFSLRTQDGPEYTIQAGSLAEMQAWVSCLSKASEEAALRRKTYLPPMPVNELKRDSQVAPLDRRNSVYGMTLDVLLEKERLMAAYGEAVTVPWIAEACMAEIERRALAEQGLYRLAGSQSEKQRLEKAFQTGHHIDLSENGSFYDINVITGAFKGWLTQLPEPVICSDLYHQLIAAMRVTDWDERTSFIRELLYQLPRPHFDLLCRILEHMERVLEHEDENKMTPYNLAICLTPSLLRPPIQDGGRDAMFNDFGPACRLIVDLMQYYRQILGEVDNGGAGSVPSSPIIPDDDSMPAPPEDQDSPLQNDRVELPEGPLMASTTDVAA